MSSDLFDPCTAVRQGNRGWLVPRADVRPEERCFVALDPLKRPRGFVQAFKDGSAAYWREPGQQGKPARSLADAFEAVFVHTDKATILTCPKCKSTELDDGVDIVKCRKCGTQVAGTSRN